MKNRPDYCYAIEPEDGADISCIDCGATISGDDPVDGRCQARFDGTPPVQLVDIVLMDRRTDI